MSMPDFFELLLILHQLWSLLARIIRPLYRLLLLVEPFTVVVLPPFIIVLVVVLLLLVDEGGILVGLLVDAEGGFLYCTRCGGDNHTVDRCYDLHGKPWESSHNPALLSSDHPNGSHQDIPTPNPPAIASSNDSITLSLEEYDALVRQQQLSLSESAGFVKSGNIVCFSSSTPSPWVIDSGASTHMTGKSDVVSQLTRSLSLTSVILAEDRKSVV